MTIPASDTVNIQPGVVGTGGNPLSLNGVLLSENALIPSESVPSFGNSDAVSLYFGPASAEYAASLKYFLGNDNSTIKPGTLYFAPYATADRAAFIRSGSLAALSLTDLQALTGVLTFTLDGSVNTSTTINLAAAISFSDAATIIGAAFTAGPTVTWQPVTSTFNFESPTTGLTSTITYATGTLSTDLKLTSATSAILSQGAVSDTPATAMDSILLVTTNWVSFSTMFEPITADKTLFAQWTTAQNQRYMYVAWDTDGQAIVSESTTCFGALVKAAAYDGVVCVSGNEVVAVEQGTTLAALTLDLAVFVLGMVASINFAQTNGRITTKFKHQAGLLRTVNSKPVADILLENGYSFYGANATANDEFIFFADGQMAGRWSWIDPFVNQVSLNSNFKLALMTLLTSITSAPYNEAGYSLIRAIMHDPIASALNFGSIRTGVTLSSSQIAQVNQAAGVDIAGTLFTQGYYLQVLDPGAVVRGNRGTPVINFWYTDGGAVQYISFPSINVM